MEVVKYNGNFTVRQHGRQQWDGEDDDDDDEVKRRVGLERSSVLKFNGEKRHPWLAGWSSLVDLVGVVSRAFRHWSLSWRGSLARRAQEPARPLAPLTTQWS